MFVLQAVIRPLVRRKLRNTVVVVVSLVLVLFLAMYAKTISQQHQTLDELYANIEVTAYITGTGGGIDGLQIEERIIEGLEDSGFIRQGIYTQRLRGLLGPWQLSRFMEYNRDSLTLVGINTVTSLPQQPEFMDDYDEKLFEGEELVCIVEEYFLASHGLFVGGELQFTAVDVKGYPVESESDVRHGAVSLKIVGTYSPASSSDPIYCPLEVTKDLSRSIGKRPLMSSGSFILQNTQDLNSFRGILMSLGFVNQQAGSGSNTQALNFIINDRLLKNATGSVQNYLDFTNALYPVIYLLCAGIGFVVSYLLIRTRKPEFAIMRSLGTSRTASFLIFFIEQGLLCLLGTALGMVVSVIATGQFSFNQFGTSLGYVCFYLVGLGVAIAPMNRVNVMGILTARE